VTTTLDAKLQEIAEKVVEAGGKRNQELYQGSNAALVAQDATTGQILVMVGSRNYFDSEIDGQFNVATQGLRQPGSALKPFAYLTALKMGYPPQTVLFDVPTEFDTTGDPEKSYRPVDYTGRFSGPMNFRTALSNSINIPAVKVLYLIGIDNLLKTLKDFGITTLNDPRRYGLSLVLGGGEVHLSELVGAYSVLAQEGVRHKQQMILKVEGRDGEILEQYKDDAVPVIDPEFPRQINDMLADPKARAPLYGNSMSLTLYPGYDVAFKTGTSNDYRDAWAINYTPSFVAGVWAGNNDNAAMTRSGGSILASVPILNAFMKEALLSQQPVAFPEPDPVYSDRPMLSGTYSEAHTILKYVNKADPTGPAPTNPGNDPQFNNWEAGVLAWVAQNSNFNVLQPTQSQDILTVHGPLNGSYIAGSSFEIRTTVASLSPVAKFEVFFNGALIDSKTELPQTFDYTFMVTPTSLLAQNSLRFVITEANGNTHPKEIILYH
jgi:membrane peptidoglycan carboxypeptidase